MLFLQAFLCEQLDRLQILRIRHPHNDFLCPGLLYLGQAPSNHIRCANEPLLPDASEWNITIKWLGFRQSLFICLRDSAVEEYSTLRLPAQHEPSSRTPRLDQLCRQDPCASPGEQ